jgi:hypothetical protein
MERAGQALMPLGAWRETMLAAGHVRARGTHMRILVDAFAATIGTIGRLSLRRGHACPAPV